jgi:hypothetical protein
MRMPMAMSSSGIAVDFIPTARPAMMLVAEPVSDCYAIF